LEYLAATHLLKGHPTQIQSTTRPDPFQSPENIRSISPPGSAQIFEGIGTLLQKQEFGRIRILAEWESDRRESDDSPAWHKRRE
jgi:hypothetical protein